MREAGRRASSVPLGLPATILFLELLLYGQPGNPMRDLLVRGLTASLGRIAILFPGVEGLFVKLPRVFGQIDFDRIGRLGQGVVGHCGSLFVP